MAETKCLTGGRERPARSNLDLKTRSRDALPSRCSRDGRGARGATTPHFICGGLGDSKARAHKGRPGSPISTSGQPVGTTLTARSEPVAARAEVEAPPRAAPGTEDATHPKRGFGSGAAPGEGRRKLLYSREEGQGKRRKTAL